MKQAAKLLLTNKQGGILEDEMCVSPDLPFDNKMIVSIVVHVIAVIFSNTTHPFLTPFYNMLNNPEALIVCYL